MDFFKVSGSRRKKVKHFMIRPWKQPWSRGISGRDPSPRPSVERTLASKDFFLKKNPSEGQQKQTTAPCLKDWCLKHLLCSGWWRSDDALMTHRSPGGGEGRTLGMVQGSPKRKPRGRTCPDPAPESPRSRYDADFSFRGESSP